MLLVVYRETLKLHWFRVLVRPYGEPVVLVPCYKLFLATVTAHIRFFWSLHLFTSSSQVFKSIGLVIGMWWTVLQPGSSVSQFTKTVLSHWAKALALVWGANEKSSLHISGKVTHYMCERGRKARLKVLSRVPSIGHKGEYKNHVKKYTAILRE